MTSIRPQKVQFTPPPFLNMIWASFDIFSPFFFNPFSVFFSHVFPDWVSRSSRSESHWGSALRGAGRRKTTMLFYVNMHFCVLDRMSSSLPDKRLKWCSSGRAPRFYCMCISQKLYCFVNKCLLRNPIIIVPSFEKALKGKMQTELEQHRYKTDAPSAGWEAVGKLCVCDGDGMWCSFGRWGISEKQTPRRQ